MQSKGLIMATLFLILLFGSLGSIFGLFVDILGGGLVQSFTIDSFISAAAGAVLFILIYAYIALQKHSFIW